MRSGARSIFCLAVCCVLLLALSAIVEAGKPQPPDPPEPWAKTIVMSIREDYDKGQDLDDIALDFALINELDIDELVVSFGWDDYEPVNDQFDLTWLHDFCNRAALYGIKLRPYLCYAPEWATGGFWNDPPLDYNDWYDYCYTIVSSLSSHSNILSYEIWNEQNTTLWWTGTQAEFKLLVEYGSNGIRAADPNIPVIFGGIVGGELAWFAPFTDGTFEQYYDIVPFHGYAEWSPGDNVETSLSTDYYDFIANINNNGEAEPVWVNEDGYSTLERPDPQQSSYLVRAVAHYLASDESLYEVEHYTCYQIKDEDPNVPMVGAEDNRYLGICDYLRNKKMGFYTYDMLTDLLHSRTITPANDEVTVVATSGRLSKNYHRLIKRDEGGGQVSQLLFVYEKKWTATADATLTTPGTTCTKWNLDGTSTDWSANFNGTVISNIPMGPGEVAIFEIMP